ncbi:FecR family protein [Halomonas sp. LS-001]
MGTFHTRPLTRLGTFGLRTFRLSTLGISTFGLSSLALFPFAAFAEMPAGRIMFVHGNAFIEREGTRQPAARGDEFYPGDTFHTAEASTLQLRYSDGGIKALRPSSSYTLTRYVLDEQTPQDSTKSGELVRGSLRAISGAIGRQTPDNVSYSTPVATMGIRGTSFQLLHIPDEGYRGLPGTAPGSYLYVETGLLAMSTTAGQTLVQPGQVFFSPAQEVAPRLLPEGIQLFEQLDGARPAIVSSFLDSVVLKPLDDIRDDIGDTISADQVNNVPALEIPEPAAPAPETPEPETPEPETPEPETPEPEMPEPETPEPETPEPETPEPETPEPERPEPEMPEPETPEPETPEPEAPEPETPEPEAPEPEMPEEPEGPEPEAPEPETPEPETPEPETPLSGFDALISNQLGFSSLESLRNRDASGTDWLGNDNQQARIAPFVSVALNRNDGNFSGIQASATRWRESDDTLTTIERAQPIHVAQNAIPITRGNIELDDNTQLYWGRWAPSALRIVDEANETLIAIEGDLHYIASNATFNTVTQAELLDLLTTPSALGNDIIPFNLVASNGLSSNGQPLVLDQNTSRLTLSASDDELYLNADFVLLREDTALPQGVARYHASGNVRLTDFTASNPNNSRSPVVLTGKDIQSGAFFGRLLGNTQATGAMGNLYVEVATSPETITSAYGNLGFERGSQEIRHVSTDLEDATATLANPAGEGSLSALYRHNIEPTAQGLETLEGGDIVWGYWAPGTTLSQQGSLSLETEHPVAFISASSELADTLSLSLSQQAFDALSSQLTAGVSFHWEAGTGLVSHRDGHIIPVLDSSVITLSSTPAQSQVDVQIHLDAFGTLQGQESIDASQAGFQTFMLERIDLNHANCAPDCFEDGYLEGRYVGEEASAIMSIIEAWGAESGDYSGTGLFKRND